MKKNEYYDMHCHFLPGMDDGCRTAEESVSVLLTSKEQGIDKICATPHYYPEETVDHFLKRRDHSYKMLLEKMGETGERFPEICLGAEVAFYTGISFEEKLNQLCYGSSHYMLLEMPFSPWTPGVLREVRSIYSISGITPVIAHLERYLKIAGKEALEELMSMHVMVQMNAEFAENFWNRKKARRMLESGMVQIMGSDSHNMTRRPPNLGTFFQYMETHNMEHIVEEISRMSKRIFKEAQTQE